MVFFLERITQLILNVILVYETLKMFVFPDNSDVIKELVVSIYDRPAEVWKIFVSYAFPVFEQRLGVGGRGELS